MADYASGSTAAYLGTGSFGSVPIATTETSSADGDQASDFGQIDGKFISIFGKIFYKIKKLLFVPGNCLELKRIGIWLVL